MFNQKKFEVLKNELEEELTRYPLFVGMEFFIYVDLLNSLAFMEMERLEFLNGGKF